MSQVSNVSSSTSSSGDVVGPASSTNNAFVLWDGTTGKLLKDGPTIVPLSQGGSNAALTADAGGIIYCTASGFAVLAHTATSNQALLSGGTSAPGWSTATYPVSTTINQLLYSSSANTIVGLATANSGVLITSAGGVPSISSTLPSAVQGNITSLGTITSGVWTGTSIAVANGGTGAGTAANARTNLGLAIGTDVQAYSAQLDSIAAVSDGIVAHTAANTFTPRTITAGNAGVTVSNGNGVSGNPTISVVGGGFPTTDVTGSTQTLAVNNRYVTNRSGGVTYTLPATASQGEVIKVVGSVGLWTINWTTNQQILIGSVSATVTSGTLVSTNAGDCVELTCTVAGASTIWRVTNSMGNITYT